jgi:diacylglycerol kinase (ATP)
MTDRVETVGAVVNPESGAGDGDSLYGELVHRMLDADITRRVTSGPDDVAAAARELADRDLLACVGGDGTLREMASALLGVEDPPPLFVVPAGRGNSVYRHLYGETDWRDIASGVADGHETAPLDVGVARTEPAIEDGQFVLGFTAGLFRSTVVHAERLAALPGRLAYVLGTARAALGDDPVTASLAVDDESVFAGDARLVAVGGGRYRGSDFELFPESRPGDGRVHAVAIEPTGATEAVAIVRLARDGRLHEHPAVHHATGTEALITAEAGLPVEMDGTPVETPITRAHIEMRTDDLRYARPAAGPDAATGNG